MRGADATGRTRFAPEARREQIRMAAEHLLLDVGCLPLPLEQIAANVGVSKALVYRYFPTQEDLFIAALTARLADIRALIAPLLKSGVAGVELVEEGMDLYFQHIVRTGPVARFILRDPFLRGKLPPEVRTLLRLVSGPFEQAIAGEAGLKPAEARAAYAMMIAIPEEGAALVRRGELDEDLGRRLCRELVSAAIAGLTRSSRA